MTAAHGLPENGAEVAGDTDERRRQLAAAVAAVESRIERACDAAGRRREEVGLIAVTKFFPASDIEILAQLGVLDIGESRDQDAADKMAALQPETRSRLRVHFVGQVQTRKSGSIARYADVVHSVDRPKLVSALSRAADAADRTLDVLVQVDLAGVDEPGSGAPAGGGRGGTPVVEAAALADLVEEAERLRLRGVMAVAPQDADPGRAFRALAACADGIRRVHPHADWISAGMSADLEAAVAHGSTLLRVGTAILGSRPAPR